MNRRNGIAAALAAGAALYLQAASPLSAQSWDLPSRAADSVSPVFDGKLKLSFEQRDRFESRTENSFGNDVDSNSVLVRTRLGVSYQPVTWLKVSGMLQDSRAPWYGDNAPNTIRDPIDLQESYFELFPDSKTGFGMSAGRRMLNYGEARLIGSPQWSNLSRTFDHARAYYRTRHVRLEMLLVSPVKILIGDFNHPNLGDRVWGTYESFPDFYKKNLLEAYVLRHDQNRPGGFTGGTKVAGTDTLGVNTFGMRLTGPLLWGTRYSIETALQNGHVGPAADRGRAWFSSVSRRWTVAGKPFDLSGEYKYASGTPNPQDTTQTRTFDQLYPANHDKFGHEDLFGWKNLHNVRSLATYGLTKNFALNFMYNNYWLASARDGLYNSSGKSIARSANGTAGTHVGQEADVFGTYKVKHFQFGAGYGHFFTGGFITHTTPGKSPVYVYVFQTYSL